MTVSARERITEYVRGAVDPAFDPDTQPLTGLLDSVSLLQLLLFIEQEFGVTPDMAGMEAADFATVDSLVAALRLEEPSDAAAA
jgi:acyl carrier protein